MQGSRNRKSVVLTKNGMIVNENKHQTLVLIASHAVIFRGINTTPLKTTAWEAMVLGDTEYTYFLLKTQLTYLV